MHLKCSFLGDTNWQKAKINTGNVAVTNYLFFDKYGYDKLLKANNKTF